MVLSWFSSGFYHDFLINQSGYIAAVVPGLHTAGRCCKPLEPGRHIATLGLAARCPSMCIYIYYLCVCAVLFVQYMSHTKKWEKNIDHSDPTCLYILSSSTRPRRKESCDQMAGGNGWPREKFSTASTNEWMKEHMDKMNG